MQKKCKIFIPKNYFDNVIWLKCVVGGRSGQCRSSDRSRIPHCTPELYQQRRTQRIDVSYIRYLRTNGFALDPGYPYL